MDSTDRVASEPLVPNGLPDAKASKQEAKDLMMIEIAKKCLGTMGHDCDELTWEQLCQISERATDRLKVAKILENASKTEQNQKLFTRCTDFKSELDSLIDDINVVKVVIELEIAKLVDTKGMAGFATQEGYLKEKQVYFHGLGEKLGNLVLTKTQLLKDLDERINQDSGLSTPDKVAIHLANVWDITPDDIKAEDKSYHSTTEEFKKRKKAIEDLFKGFQTLSKEFQKSFDKLSLMVDNKSCNLGWFDIYYSMGWYRYFTGQVQLASAKEQPNPGHPPANLNASVMNPDNVQDGFQDMGEADEPPALASAAAGDSTLIAEQEPK
jgi:hypothetical protein